MLDGTGVRFDFGTAHEAARQLRLTAGAIDLALHRVAADLPKVTKDWHGAARVHFDATIVPHQNHGADIAELLRIIAVNVEARAILARAAIASGSPR